MCEGVCVWHLLVCQCINMSVSPRMHVFVLLSYYVCVCVLYELVLNRGGPSKRKTGMEEGSV